MDYELCKFCWHFVEPNPTHTSLIQGKGWNNEALRLATHIHLDDGEKEYDHDAEPSGIRHSLETWRSHFPALFEQHQDGKIGPNSRFFSGTHVPHPAGADAIETAVARAKREILNDVAEGKVPASKITSFADLHDYVDANEYGGLTEDEPWVNDDEAVKVQDTFLNQDFMEAANEVQNRVDSWIKDGGLR